MFKPYEKALWVVCSDKVIPFVFDMYILDILLPSSCVE